MTSRRRLCMVIKGANVVMKRCIIFRILLSQLNFGFFDRWRPSKLNSLQFAHIFQRTFIFCNTTTSCVWSLLLRKQTWLRANISIFNCIIIKKKVRFCNSETLIKLKFPSSLRSQISMIRNVLSRASEFQEFSYQTPKIVT